LPISGSRPIAPGTSRKQSGHCERRWHLPRVMMRLARFCENWGLQSPGRFRKRRKTRSHELERDGQQLNPQPLLCIRVLLVGAAVLLAPMALSQEQHPAAPPPPPNAKKVQCKGRPVPQLADVTEKSGLAAPCFAMGGAVADYNNDGWPDLYLTCLGGNVLFRNNGDGTFTDVTAKAGVADGRMSVGAAFGDYDRDGFVDLMVANY